MDSIPKAEFSVALLQSSLVSVKWSFRNDLNILVWCSKTFPINNVKNSCVAFSAFGDNCDIFDQFNVSLLKKLLNCPELFYILFYFILKLYS